MAAAAAPASTAAVRAALDSLEGTAVSRVMARRVPLAPEQIKRLGALAALEEARTTCPAVERALAADPSLFARLADTTTVTAR